jgi:hypothetical protein
MANWRVLSLAASSDCRAKTAAVRPPKSSEKATTAISGTIRLAEISVSSLTGIRPGSIVTAVIAVKCSETTPSAISTVAIARPRAPSRGRMQTSSASAPKRPAQTMDAAT